MPYVETRGGAVINGTSITKNQTSKLVGVWDGGSESTTVPQVFQTGEKAAIHINWTSGTFAIEISPFGSNSWKPLLYNGAYTIGASAVIAFEAPARCLLRITGATAVGTVTIVRGA